MNSDTEIRTLTLRFATVEQAKRFAALCKRHGDLAYRGWDGVWITVTAVFQNKAAKSRLVQAWARESMILTE